MTALTNPLLLIVMVGVLAAGTGYGIWTLRRASDYDATRAALSREGIETQAEIVDKRSVVQQSGRRSTSVQSTRYYVTYRYSVPRPGGAAAYSTEVEIARADFETLNTGAGLQVRYLPDQPTRVQIWTGARERQSSDFLRRLGWSSILGASGFVIFLLIWFSLPRSTSHGAGPDGGAPTPTLGQVEQVAATATAAAQSTSFSSFTSLNQTAEALLNSGTSATPRASGTPTDQ